MAPLFSIGLTTYNRRELLKQALTSVLAQSFTDFEVLVGNDYVQGAISYDDLGVRDPRVRIINHSVNLKERGNANALLALSSGRYFTLFADDDVYVPTFLETLHTLIEIHGCPPVAFTSYRIFKELDFPDMPMEVHSESKLFTGRNFLKAYFDGKVKVIGPYGAIDAQWLKSIGGFEQMCDGPVELFGEYMLIVRMAALPHIAYTDAPLVFYRWHDGAWSGSNLNLDKYAMASESLVGKSIPILLTEPLKPDLRANIHALMELTANNHMDKVVRAKGRVRRRDLQEYVGAVVSGMSTTKLSVLSRAALRFGLRRILLKGLAERNRAIGMQAYNRGDLTTARTCLLYAVTCKVSLLLSRHVLSVLLQSVIGRNVVEGTRRFLRRVLRVGGE